MAAKAKTATVRPDPIKKRTSIGNSCFSRPKNKRSSRKRYRGQGRP
jgi:hypothetical protein